MYEIVEFTGYMIRIPTSYRPWGSPGGSGPTTDLHVVDERGRTQRRFALKAAGGRYYSQKWARRAAEKYCAELNAQ